MPIRAPWKQVPASSDCVTGQKSHWARRLQLKKKFIEKSTNKQQEIQKKKKICRAKLHMYSILHYITNCLNFHSISTTNK